MLTLEHNTLEALTFILFILEPYTVSDLVFTEIGGDGDRPFNIFGYNSVTRVMVIAQTSAVSILLLPRPINVRARCFLSAVLEENTSEMTDMRVEG